MMKTTERNVYLKMKTLAEARQLLLEYFPAPDLPKRETVAVPQAVGRVLAEPVTARLSSPGFNAAAMDGIAVKAERTFGTSESHPRTLEVGREAFYVNTGHLLPTGTDAVIMIEHVQVLDERRVSIESAVFPWQHVRKTGEDIVATELLFAHNHKVTPYCVGALLSAGVFRVSVTRKPRVLIIPTGSELVDWRQSPATEVKPGQVLETNSFVLGGLVEACGADYRRHDMLADDVDKIAGAIADAVDSDIDVVLTVGGSSAGSEDYTRRVVDRLGRVLVHGVTIMPGKPVLVGAVQDKPIFGIPGYPVSAIVAFEQFVQPLLYRLQGQSEPQRRHIQVSPSRKIASKLGVEEFLRVKLGQVGQRVVATPLPRGAGCITSLTDADGIIRIPNAVEGLAADAPVTAELIRPRRDITNTIVAVGSHDNSLDILADELQAGGDGLTLSSSHVGSMGGLMALKKGMCHLAGSHLLDTKDGSYNISYIKKYLKTLPVVLIHLVLRDQGLIVPAGNPKHIGGIEDLVREDVVFINRQGGSGTRILLDYRLQQLGLDPAAIDGYGNDEFTHMAVAVAVLSGRVDVGLGIHAAAKALKLDFIPVVTEQYDLVIPQNHFESSNVQHLLGTIATARFKSRVAALGGYNTDRTGEIVWRSS